MSTARYRSFVAVAQHGSLSAAARALGVSQPTVSSQIATLERQSQLELFHRQGYRMTLTSTGHKLLVLAQRLLAQEAETEYFLRDSGKLHQGELKVGAVGPFHVMEMVAAYRAHYPGMQLSIRMGNSQQVLQELEHCSTDVAVLAGWHDRPGLQAQPYARHPILVFVHRDHPFAQHSSVALQALQGQPLLLREKGSTTREAIETALQKAGIEPQRSLEIGSREAIREAVVRGLGVGVVSEAEFVPDARIVPVRIEGAPASTTTYVYCLKERSESLLVRSFLQMLPVCCAQRSDPAQTRSA